MEKALREQREDRPIDQSAGQDFLFRGTSLAFDESARDLSGGVGILPVIHGEREKPGTRLRLVRHTRGDQYDGITGADDDSAACLFGHLARFKGDLTSAQVYFNCMLH